MDGESCAINYAESEIYFDIPKKPINTNFAFGTSCDWGILTREDRRQLGLQGVNLEEGYIPFVDFSKESQIVIKTLGDFLI